MLLAIPSKSRAHGYGTLVLFCGLVFALTLLRNAGWLDERVQHVTRLALPALAAAVEPFHLVASVCAAQPPPRPFVRWSKEGQRLRLDCGEASEDVLSITSASWGYLAGWQPDSGVGAECPWRSAASENLGRPTAACRVLSFTSAFQALCNGSASCEVERAQLPGQDVCPNFAKTLLAAWTCHPRASPAPAPAAPLNGSRVFVPQSAAAPSTGTVARDLSGMSGEETVVSAPSTGNASGSANTSLSESGTRSRTRHCEMVTTAYFGGAGLWNQLIVVQHVAAMAWSAGCGLSVLEFNPDYNSGTPPRMPFDKIFDLDQVNRALAAAHPAALRHPSTTFFKPETGGCPSPDSCPPLRVSAAPKHYPGWMDASPACMFTWRKMTIVDEASARLYDDSARAVQRHPNPGSLWNMADWDRWAGVPGPVAGIRALRRLFVDSIVFAPPFAAAATALQAAMAVSGGRFTFVHLRVESDMSVHAGNHRLTLEQYLEHVYGQTVAAVDGLVNLNRSAGSAELAMARRIRAWPIYLGTGVLAVNTFVARFRQRYPWAVVYTKDMLLYDHCALMPPQTTNLSALLPSLSEAQRVSFPQRVRALTAGLSALPWTGGVTECTWLRNEVLQQSARPNREYWAILDWMLAREAAHFVGPLKSSFSVSAVDAIDSQPRTITYADAESGVALHAQQFAVGLEDY